ncbi:hypothetical protein [Gynurincola endophyticus]|uniref:hypothetical protein n=1 Tax=Gynurincola endophyticus TaxID=2479004 RepID=UPI000F8CD735|nr:hypothetical protein [Gynurincola endophyticus]
MKKIASFLLILLSLSNITFGQNTKSTRVFLNDKVEITLEDSYKEESQEKIIKEYPDPTMRPSVILVNKENKTSIKFIKMPQRVSNRQVKEFKEFHMSHMKKERGIEWIEDGVIEQFEKNIGFIKVIYTEKESFTYFLFTSLDGQLLLINFTSPASAWPDIKTYAEEIMSSLKVN